MNGREADTTSHDPAVADSGLAIVAGAGPVGRATAVALAEAGRTVVLINRSLDAMRELPDGIRPELADPTDAAQVKTAIDRLAAELGPPTVLVNTVGMYTMGDAIETTPDALKRSLDVNLGAALWLSQAVATHMKRAGTGAIVHIASRPALEPAAGVAAYSISKAALVHLTKVLDVELRPHGIRINAVAPQLIDTAENRAAIPAGVMAHAVAPEAIAEAILFLVSDGSAPISGAIVPVYGG